MTTKTKQGFLLIPYQVWEIPTLSLGAKAIYCLIRKYTEDGKTCFASNPFLAKNMGKGIGSVKRYLKELEDEGLITRSMKNSKRILYAYPITKMASSEMNHSQNTDQSNNEPPIDQICTTASSEPNLTMDHDRSRYNIDNKINNKIVYNKHICKDNENLIWNYILQWGYGTGEGWADIVNTLSKLQMNQLEKYLQKNRKDQYKDKIKDIVQNKTYVTQKQI